MMHFIFIVIIADFVLNNNKIAAHLHWRENLVQDESKNSQKQVLYELNGIIPTRSHELLFRKRDYGGLSVDITAYCPASYFDSIPIPKFFLANRLYYADTYDDTVLWQRYNGVLPPHTIISLQSENDVFLLLQDRAHSMHEFVSYETGDISHADVDLCIEQYKQFVDVIVSLLQMVRHHRTEFGSTSVCGKAFPLPDSLETKLQKEMGRRLQLHPVAVWVEHYLNRVLNPYLLHPVYCVHDLLSTSWKDSHIIAHKSLDWVDAELAALSQVASMVLVVADISLPISLPISYCLQNIPHKEIHTNRTAISTCTMKIRKLFPLYQPKGDQPISTANLDGAASHTASAWYCITSPLSESLDEVCHLSPNYMHQYIKQFLAVGMPLSPYNYHHLYHPDRDTYGKDSTKKGGSETPRLLNIGLGGGAIPHFFSLYYPSWSVDTVEIDTTAVQFFEDYFDGDTILCAKQYLQVKDSLLLQDFNTSEFNILEKYYMQDLPVNSSVASKDACHSRIILSNAFTYIAYQAALVDRAKQHGNERHPQLKETSVVDYFYDIIFFDAYDSTPTMWDAYPFSGISNLLLQEIVQPHLHEMYTILRPSIGILYFHLHKDSQVIPFVLQSLVDVFGMDQIVVFESGMDLLIAAGKDVFFVPSTTTNNSQEQNKQSIIDERIQHPCYSKDNTSLLSFARYIRDFRPSNSRGSDDNTIPDIYETYPKHIGIAHQYDIDCTALSHRWDKILRKKQQEEQGQQEMRDEEVILTEGDDERGQEEFFQDSNVHSSDEYADDENFVVSVNVKNEPSLEL